MTKEEIIELIKSMVHCEEHDIETVGKWVSITTKIWEPNIYNFDDFEEIGLVFHGQLGESYIFKRK